MDRFTVIALYKFVDLPDCEELRLPLLAFCEEHGIKGTLLLAEEGINGTVAGKDEDMQALISFLQGHDRFADIEYKTSYSTEMPFYRMKVRIKKEIVTMGVPGVNPNRQVGKYVSPREWNDLITAPDVVVVDTRNDYEVKIGTFKGALDPKTKTFREFPRYVEENMKPVEQKKVAMFCTGGIRCEKATAYMLQQGFEEVYHLKGGILKYLEEVEPEDSLWEGECFVFDHRVAVKHGLEEGDFQLCYACQQPLGEKELVSPDYEEGVSCPFCKDNLTEEKVRRLRQRQQQIKLAKSRNEQHLGAKH